MKYTPILGVFLAILCVSKECLGNDLTISQMMEYSITYSTIMSYIDTQVVRDTNSLSNNQRMQERKSAGRALFISVVPGFVVHGAGHFYAAKPKTGMILLGTEVVGIGLMVGSGISAIATENRPPDYWVALGLGGFILFVGTWVYDILGSQNAVDKFNESS